MYNPLPRCISTRVTELYFPNFVVSKSGSLSSKTLLHYNQKFLEATQFNRAQGLVKSTLVDEAINFNPFNEGQ